MPRVLEIHRRKWTNSKPCRRFASRLTPTWQGLHVSRYLRCHEYPEQFLSVTVIRANTWQAAGKYISQMMVEFHFPCPALLSRLVYPQFCFILSSHGRVRTPLPHPSHQTKSFPGVMLQPSAFAAVSCASCFTFSSFEFYRHIPLPENNCSPFHFQWSCRDIQPLPAGLMAWGFRIICPRRA